jgi:hypothetical protein
MRGCVVQAKVLQSFVEEKRRIVCYLRQSFVREESRAVTIVLYYYSVMFFKN